MEIYNKKMFINDAIIGLVLFILLTAFLFIIGDKEDDYLDFDFSSIELVLYTSIFSFFEFLACYKVAYFPDEKMDYFSAFFISVIYSLVIGFVAYVFSSSGGSHDSDFEYINFIAVFLAVELSWIIISYLKLEE